MLVEQLLQKNFADFANILSPVYGHADGFLQHPNLNFCKFHHESPSSTRFIYFR